MHSPRRRAGFTLIELLTVIAIIGILATALIPAVGAVRKKARAATAQAAFTQWASGVVRYKSVYGFYPNIGTTYPPDKDICHSFETGTVAVNFVKALSAKKLDGTPLSSTERKQYNRNLEEFVSFSKDDYLSFETNTADSGVLVDRFGNKGIRVILDTSNSGTLQAPIDGLPVAAKIPTSLSILTDATKFLPARVVIYTTPLDVVSDTLDSNDVVEVIVIQ